MPHIGERSAEQAYPQFRRTTRSPGASQLLPAPLHLGELDAQGRLLQSGYDRLIDEAHCFIDERPNSVRTAVIHWGPTTFTKVTRDGIEGEPSSFPIELGR